MYIDLQTSQPILALHVVQTFWVRNPENWINDYGKTIHRKEFSTNTANERAPSQKPLPSDELEDSASLKDICEREQATGYLRDQRSD